MRVVDVAALGGYDRIEITGIAASGVHGVYADEAVAPQAFTVDVVVWLDLADAVATDDVVATLDYVALAAGVVDLVATRSFRLIESLADAVAAALLDQPRVEAAQVTVHKPRAAADTGATDVAVRVTRGRS